MSRPDPAGAAAAIHDPAVRRDPGAELARLLEVMARLRDPETGCPWDREQTFATIAPFTIEEAYEVADAIARNAMDDLPGELGDLLLQVVYHARMAEEQGRFDFADVAHAIAAKMIERHPHVFAEQQVAGTGELHRVWEERKAAARAVRAQAEGADASQLADIPLALPALTRALKLQRRAARVGFDWPDVGGVLAKVEEEAAELAAAASAKEREAELGDLLFTLVNLARHLEVEPEVALRAANHRFEQRFRAMEQLTAEDSRGLADLDAAELDALWRRVKGR